MSEPLYDEPGVIYQPPQKIGIGIDFGMTFSGASIFYWNERRANSFAVIQCDTDQDDAPKFETLVFEPGGGGAVTVGHAAGVRSANGESGELYELFKVYLGKPEDERPATLRGDPQRLTAEVFQHIKSRIDRFLQRPDAQNLEPHYCFTLPGMWDDRSRRALNRAIRAAGFENFAIAEEPVAMAVAASRLGLLPRKLRHDRGRYVLVCDFGGGTFDLSLISTDPAQPVRTKALPGGNGHLGMSNLDKSIELLVLMKQAVITPNEYGDVIGKGTICGKRFDALWDEGMRRVNEDSSWQYRFRTACESLKRSVCDHWGGLRGLLAQREWSLTLPSGERVSVTREEVAPLIAAMRQAALDATHRYLMSDLNLVADLDDFDPKSIDYALIGGGGAKLPGIEATIQSALPHATVFNITEAASQSHDSTTRQHAMGLVQLGAAIIAAEPDIVKERRAPASYGFGAWSQAMPKYPSDADPAMRKMIPINGVPTLHYKSYQRFFVRGYPLPTRPVEIPTTPEKEGQADFAIPIYCGEDEDVRQNRLVGVVRGRFAGMVTMRGKLTVKCFIGEDGEFKVIGETDNIISDEVTLDLPDDDI